MVRSALVAMLVFVFVSLALPRAPAARGIASVLDVGHPLLLDVGHTNAVTSLALSPDGAQLASSSKDGTVRLFDARTGSVRAELRVAGEVFDVAFSPDGARIATGSTYNLVKLWDARTTAHLETFDQNRTWVTSVAYSPDGRFLASCDTQAGVVIRDLAQGTTRKLPVLAARRVAWRPDGRALAVVALDRFLLFDASAWEQRPDAGPSAAPVPFLSTVVGRFATVAIAWNRSGGELAFGELDVRVTDLRGGGARVLPAKRPSVLAFSPDGARLAIGGRDGAIEIRDRGSDAAIARLVPGDGSVTSLLWSHDGGRLFAGDEHGGISVWSVAKGERLVDIPAQAPGIGAVAWGPHDRLATSHALWDLTAGRIVAALDPVTWSVSWCGDVLVTLGKGGITWRVGNTGAVVASAPALTRASQIICSPDGRWALAHGDGIEVWDARDHTGEKVNDEWVGSAAWGPGDRVALGFAHTLEIWRVGKGKPAREVRRSGRARVLAWRADGLIAADIGASHRIDRDWVETGVSALHAADLTAAGRWFASCVPDSLDRCDWSGLGWSPGGDRLATIVDRVLSVTETPRARRRRSTAPSIPGHPGAYDVSWSPDGGLLAAADAAGVLLIRIRDAATMRLRDVRVADRLLGLIDDGHGRFCGDGDLSARVVTQPATGAPGLPDPPPARDADLLARFLGPAR